MKRPELQHHFDQMLRCALLVAALVLGAAGLASPAQAAGSIMKTVPEMTQAGAQKEPMPGAMNGVPCMGCYMAPAPAMHGLTGEQEQPKQAGWLLLAQSSASAKTLQDQPTRETGVPLRVAYCCWRN